MKQPTETIDTIIRQNTNGIGENEALQPDKTFGEIGLTSFGLMRSLLQMEKELGVKVITPKTVRNLKTIRDLHALFQS